MCTFVLRWYDGKFVQKNHHGQFCTKFYHSQCCSEELWWSVLYRIMMMVSFVLINYLDQSCTEILSCSVLYWNICRVSAKTIKVPIMTNYINVYNTFFRHAIIMTKILVGETCCLATKNACTYWQDNDILLPVQIKGTKSLYHTYANNLVV